MIVVKQEAGEPNTSSSNGFVASGQQSATQKQANLPNPDLAELYKRVRGPLADTSLVMNWFKTSQEKVDKLMVEYKPTIFHLKSK